MKITIRNYHTNPISEKFDILIPGVESTHTSYVDFEFEEPNQKITAKFFLHKDAEELGDYNFCHFKNTNLLFYRLTYQWGIIDIKTGKLKRNVMDRLLDFPFFYLHENCILVVDDSFAETLTLDGDSIDKIGNEQPYEVKEFEDYFEFDIIGVAKRKLLKKGMLRDVKLTQIKLLHTIIWLFFNVVIFYFLYAVIIDKIDWLVWTCIGLLVTEGLVLLLFKSICPVTLLARKYSDSQKQNFDIYLPEWLAKYNKAIYTSIVVIAIVILIYRLST